MPASPVVSPPASKSATYLLVAAKILSWLFIVPSSLMLLGLLVQGIPYYSTFASALATPLLPHLLYLALVGGLAAGVVWRNRRTTRWLALAGVAASTVLGFGLVAGWQSAAMTGVPISIAKELGTVAATTARSDTTVVYTTYANEPLRLSIYATPLAPTQPKKPVLLYVHGGGWISGDRLQSSAGMRWFADHGWVVVSIDYSLSTAKQHLWNVTEKQVASAMAWTAQHIAAYGGDITRLALTGDSAGGNLAINCAYQANKGTLVATTGGAVPKVAAVSVLYPVVDPSSFYQNKDALLANASRGMAGNYTGGSPREFPDRYRAIASATHIHAAAPPTLILVGTQDHLVPEQPAFAFAQLTQQAGIKTKIVGFPLGDHGFNAFYNSIGDQAFRQLSQQWFIENGVLTGQN